MNDDSILEITSKNKKTSKSLSKCSSGTNKCSPCVPSNSDDSIKDVTHCTTANKFQTLPVTNTGQDDMSESDDSVQDVTNNTNAPNKSLRPSVPPPRSILRKSSHTTTESQARPPDDATVLKHTYNKIIEFAFKVDGDDKLQMAYNNICALFENIRYCDSSAVIYPCSDSTASPIHSKAALPENFAKLGELINFQSGAWALNDKKDANGAKRLPEIYASAHIASNVPPEDYVRKISFEYNRIKGTVLRVKPLQAFRSSTP